MRVYSYDDRLPVDVSHLREENPYERVSEQKWQIISVMKGRHSHALQRIVDVIAALATTIFTLGISLSFRSVRKMWINVFFGRKVVYHVEKNAYMK